MLVNDSRKALARLVATGESASVITTLKLGDEGHQLTPTVDYFTAVSPTVSDEDLNSTVYTETITEYEFLPDATDTTSVKFTIVIGVDEANTVGGVTKITEAGLFTAGGDLFSRETFPVISKTDTRQITIEFTILF